MAWAFLIVNSLLFLLNLTYAIAGVLEGRLWPGALSAAASVAVLWGAKIAWREVAAAREEGAAEGLAILLSHFVRLHGSQVIPRADLPRSGDLSVGWGHTDVEVRYQEQEGA